MELQSEPLAGRPRDSATVVMLRDGAAGLEVFILERHGLSDVLGGAYVFPGGKLDAEDATLAPHLDIAPADMHARLGEPGLDEDTAVALFGAAVREVFEETGVLFGADAAAADRVRALVRDGLHFNDAVALARTRLAASALVPWVRWITPLVGGVIRKRFDTRFFVAATPPGQPPVHDTHEAVASLWIAPRDALRRYWEGAIEIAPPQIMSLSHLAHHHSVASVLDEARGRTPPCIRPHPFEADGGRAVCYPGDPLHPEPGRPWPGPTRLFWRGRRYEPEHGLAALTGTAEK